MSKKPITAPLAPPAVGPYSHAVVANGFVFTAGQIGLIPGTTQLVAGGVREQTAQVLDNLQAVLQAAGSDLNQVVKTTVFLANMDDYASVNEVYAHYFWRTQPARSAVEVAKLPLGALVEIETVALV